MSTNKSGSILLRLGLLLLLTLGWAGLSQAAPTYVQHKVDAATTPWVTDAVAEVTFDSALTVGNTVCVFGFLEANRTHTTTTDNGSTPNTYTAPSNADMNDANSSAFARCSKVGFSATVVSMTISSASAATGRIAGVEFSGTGASAPTVGTQLNDATGTTHTAPTLTITGANPVLLGFVANNGTEVWTMDGTFISLYNTNPLMIGYKPVTGNDDMANTTATNAATKSILIEIVEAASAATPRNLMLMGVGN